MYHNIVYATVKIVVLIHLLKWSIKFRRNFYIYRFYDYLHLQICTWYIHVQTAIDLVESIHKLKKDYQQPKIVSTIIIRGELLNICSQGQVNWSSLLTTCSIELTIRSVVVDINRESKAIVFVFVFFLDKNSWSALIKWHMKFIIKSTTIGFVGREVRVAQC